MSFRTIKVWTYIWYPTAARSFHVYVEWYDHNCMINGAIMAASFGIMYDCCVNHNGRCPWICILNRNRIWNHCNHTKAFSLFELSKMYRLLNGGQMWSKTSSTSESNVEIYWKILLSDKILQNWVTISVLWLKVHTWIWHFQKEGGIVRRWDS